MILVVFCGTGKEGIRRRFLLLLLLTIESGFQKSQSTRFSQPQRSLSFKWGLSSKVRKHAPESGKLKKSITSMTNRENILQAVKRIGSNQARGNIRFRSDSRVWEGCIRNGALTLTILCRNIETNCAPTRSRKGGDFILISSVIFKIWDTWAFTRINLKAIVHNLHRNEKQRNERIFFWWEKLWW